MSTNSTYAAAAMPRPAVHSCTIPGLAVTWGVANSVAPSREKTGFSAWSMSIPKNDAKASEIIFGMSSSPDSQPPPSPWLGYGPGVGEGPGEGDGTVGTG